MIVMRNCPVCKDNTFSVFLEERIHREKLNAFSYSSRKEPEFMNHKMVKCDKCSCVYVLEPPLQEELTNSYSEADYDSNEEAICAAKTYIKELKPFLAKLNTKSCAVDIGAGNGAILPFFKYCGFEKTVGIEPSKAAIMAAPKNIQSMLHEGIFTKELLAQLNPSLICSFMTLEHLSQPQELVEYASQCLEEGAMVAIVVHDYTAFLNTLLGKRSPIIDIEHLQLFCPQAIKVLFEKYGFKEYKIVHFKNSYPLAYWLRLSPLPKVIKKIYLKLFLC